MDGEKERKLRNERIYGTDIITLKSFNSSHQKL